MAPSSPSQQLRSLWSSPCPTQAQPQGPEQGSQPLSLLLEKAASRASIAIESQGGQSEQLGGVQRPG